MSQDRFITWVVFACGLAVGACTDDAAPAPDTTPIDTTALPELAPETVDTTQPETQLAPETVPEVEEDTEPPAPVDPFDVADPTPPFLPEDPAPVEPLGCPAISNAGGEFGDTSGWKILEGTFIASSVYPVPFAGTYDFRAGTSPTSRMAQDVDVSTYTAGIASGDTRIANLRVFMRNDEDEPSLRLTALAADGSALATRKDGPYLNDEWQEGEVALALPAGTKKVRVELIGNRMAGGDNDAFFDDAQLCIYDQPPSAILAGLLGPPYLMNVKPDGVSVLFETRSPTWAAVDYGTSPDHLDDTVTVDDLVTTHIVRLTGLTPNTRYYYRVRYADLQLPPYDFLTARAPEDDGRVEFIMFADNQDGPNIFRKLAKQMAALDPDFILHAGDVVQNGQRFDYRETFFSPFFGFGNHAAIIMGPGNHETYSSAILTSNESRRLWEEYVDQPGDEHCFGFRWGQLFVMVLDSEMPLAEGSPQYACIESALTSESAQSATFRVALFHRSPLIEYWDSVAGATSEITFYTFGMDAPDVRYYLAPLFQRTRVELVFNGHNHLYQFVPRWPEFTAWVISGGGGGGLESGIPDSKVADWSPFVSKQIFGRHHFLHVIIQDDIMWVRAVGDQGDVLDEFQITP